MANLLHNDPTQTVPAANAAMEDLHSFRAATRQFAELAASTTALTGQAKTALMNSGQRVNEAGERYFSIAEPRIESIRQSAEDATRVGDEGATALNGTDIAF